MWEVIRLASEIEFLLSENRSLGFLRTWLPAPLIAEFLSSETSQADTEKELAKWTRNSESHMSAVTTLLLGHLILQATGVEEWEAAVAKARKWSDEKVSSVFEGWAKGPFQYSKYVWYHGEHAAQRINFKWMLLIGNVRGKKDVQLGRELQCFVQQSLVRNLVQMFCSKIDKEREFLEVEVRYNHNDGAVK